MRLRRIWRLTAAKLVARGVRRYNGVRLSPKRVIARPHYLLLQSGKIVGWIGVERRNSAACEICHLSVLPAYRRRGLAESAVKQGLSLVRRAGASYAYARILSTNNASKGLLRKLGFRKTKGGRICIYARQAT